MNPTQQQAKLLEVDELVINWHITEACNYSCTYCYAKWNAEPGERDIARDPEAVHALLTAVRRFFDPDNADNPLRRHLRWRSLRLSLAGGEPTLYWKTIDQVMQTAADLGFRLSLITNGSLLHKVDIAALAGRLSVLGISLDSADPLTNKRIGRSDKHGMLSLTHLSDMVALARESNPRLAVKVNTVVNPINAGQDMRDILLRLRPDRWKVLRVLPIVDASLVIGDGDFAAFLKRHAQFASIMAPEDNRVMTESYIMIDPLGRFFQNTAPSIDSSPYRYSAPILQAGAEQAFTSIRFSPAVFAARYLPFTVDEKA